MGFSASACSMAFFGSGFFFGKFGGIFPAGHDIKDEQNTANGDDDPSFTIHDL
ncbi:hypothetical protein OAF33_01270 [bacterium]|nr:hypothetical protein [bacterium]